MDTVEAWQQISQERQNLCRYLEHLPDEKWDSTSIRTGWTIKQLVAHIILESNYTWFFIAKYIVQAHFDTNKFMDIAARRFASSHSLKQTLDALRANIKNHRLPPGITAQEALIDLWIHTQDIRQAVGEAGSLPAAQMEAILDFVHANPTGHGLKVMGIPEKLNGKTYVLTDYKNFQFGTGSTHRNLTKHELFKELINL